MANDEQTPGPSRDDRFLSALLSQALVAFTLEVDNEFEMGMKSEGYDGISLSLVLWLSVFQFIDDGGLTVRELSRAAVVAESTLKFKLGCLERWRFIELEFDPIGETSGRRDGWGSGRGIRSSWIVRLTPRGDAAKGVWPPLTGRVERRWENRFGSEAMAEMRGVLQQLVDSRDLDLPLFLPSPELSEIKLPPRSTSSTASSAELPTLLSQALLLFRVEFDRQSRLPIDICASAIRVLGAVPIREAEIPRLTGGSSESTGIGWQLKPYIVVEPDPEAKRGKVVSLSTKGLAMQALYKKLNVQIERGWESRFGDSVIDRLRASMEGLFRPGPDGRPLISEGLVPAAGTVRSGLAGPSLGRREVSPAATQRARDMFNQSRLFVADPERALPHYPVWDMNRGFGP